METNRDTRMLSGEERHAAETAAGMPDSFEKMKEMDIREADINALADILEIKIDSDLDSTEKRGNSSGRSKTRICTGRGSILSN